MNKEVAAPKAEPQQSFDWKQILVFGGIVGAVAGGVALGLPKWYNIALSFGMMLSSWLIVNRTTYRFALQGFLASIVTGVVGWAIFLPIDYDMFPTTNLLMLTLTFMLPTIIMISGLGSWLFGRTRKRMLETQQKEEEERRELKKQYMQSRPKKKFKKKK